MTRQLAKPRLECAAMSDVFGKTFAAQMSVAYYRDGEWEQPKLQPTGPMQMHPASHVLHYASECFEGLKAYRRADGGVHIFRLDKHIERMRNSARQLCLPVPSAEMLNSAIMTLVDSVRDQIPAFPSALYIRPTLIGMEPNIGAAGKAVSEAMLYVLVSPVGEYFTSERTLKLLVTSSRRTTEDFGQVKTGGNYAAALRHVIDARQQYQADQVLFAPDDDVQETGAANFLLLNDKRILTKQLDGSILPGITRDSLLTLAQDQNFSVDERSFGVAEMLEWIKDGEAALSGTAAVLAPVGALIVNGVEHAVHGGTAGETTTSLRKQLTAIQSGEADDPHGWRIEL